MKEMDLFLFDLDGTLIDSTQDIANAVNFTLERLGEPQLTETMILQNVGDGVLHLLRKSIVENHQHRVEEAVSIFRSRYGEHLLDHTKMYSGVKEILEYFSGKNKAVITNKPERYLDPIFRGLGIQHQIDCAIGGDGTRVPKPSAEPVREMLSHFHVKQARVVMIGDSPVDMETGKLGGVLTCAVTYGYRSREELEKAEPDYMIDDLLQLKEIFC